MKSIHVVPLAAFLVLSLALASGAVSPARAQGMPDVPTGTGPYCLAPATPTTDAAPTVPTKLGLLVLGARYPALALATRLLSTADLRVPRSWPDRVATFRPIDAARLRSRSVR